MGAEVHYYLKLALYYVKKYLGLGLLILGGGIMRTSYYLLEGTGFCKDGHNKIIDTFMPYCDNHNKNTSPEAKEFEGIVKSDDEMEKMYEYQ